MEAPQSSAGWGRRALEEVATAQNTTAPDHPERTAYVDELIRTLLEGRSITATYNIAMVALLLWFSVACWRRRTLDRRKWRGRIFGERRREGLAAGAGAGAGPNLDIKREPAAEIIITAPRHLSVFSIGGDETTSSSSSSTIQGTATPPTNLDKDADADVERLPLLSRSDLNFHRKQRGRSRATSSLARVCGWLAYQPRPIPIINRTLPSNAVTLFVLAWAAINAFFFLWRAPLSGPFLFVPADRAGVVFMVNLPLLYLLAAKNQPLRLLTGRSYEALNVFHRRVGELVCLAAAYHVGAMILFQFVLAPEWLNPVSAAEYLFHPRNLLGFGALVAYELLYVTSLASLRQKCYELFLASHVVLQILGLVFLYLHFPTAHPYVLVSLAIFVVDRLVWRLRVKSATLTADVTILEDGETIVLSADWDIPSSSSSRGAMPNKNVIAGWRPSDHVFLTIPALGRGHALQTHPFTIASAAPLPFPGAEQREQQLRRRRMGDDNKPTHAWLSLLIRTHSGFTRDLLQYAREHGASPPSAECPASTPVRLSVRLDGPYGSSRELDMLRASDTVVLVAGGSGIAVVYPLAAALLLDDRRLEDEVDDGDDCGGEDDRSNSYKDDGDDRSAEANAALLAPPVGRHRRGGGGREAATSRSGRRRRQRVHLLWVTRSRSHRSWIPAERLDELVDAGLDLVAPDPTMEAGRPDTAGLVRGWVDDGGSGDVGVIVSGPDGLNREVRNVCAAAISEGASVRVTVEKFGW